jgi:hypothetical protein
MMALGAMASPMLQAESAEIGALQQSRGMAVASSRQQYHPPVADLVVQRVIR